MINLEVKDEEGNAGEEIEASEELLGLDFHRDLLYRAVKAYRENGRSGSANTKDRSEVKGSNRKPWRQKGTGRARHGSRASPLWAGGGVIFGPEPKDYGIDLPKKMKHKAIRSGLSTRYSEGNLVLVEKLDFEEPKTKRGLAVLEALDLPKDTLIIVSQEEEDWRVRKSFSNIPSASYIPTSRINAYDILNHEGILLTKGSVSELGDILLDTSRETQEV
ncbi:50S ribosomal protein L4 [Candidatus Bipolaricaulota bacterium]|nr:50S ribosomal protein L4 [Candidatus Bipolaricaulota bacterium]